MLVLSRRVNERVILPDINTSITLVESRPGTSRLGVDAPETIKIIREEIMPADQVFGSLLNAKQVAHKLRNRLNSGTTGLTLIRHQIEQGVDEQTVLKTLERVCKGMCVEDAIRDAAGIQPAKMRALLVEDDENERELLAGLLRMCGIEVKAVEDGDDALVYLKNNQTPDVILLDLHLPRMNGADFVRAVRDQGVPTKIFMVTGSEPPTQVPPVDRWLRKPLNPDHLLQALCTV